MTLVNSTTWSNPGLLEWIPSQHHANCRKHSRHKITSKIRIWELFCGIRWKRGYIYRQESSYEVKKPQQKLMRPSNQAELMQICSSSGGNEKNKFSHGCVSRPSVEATLVWIRNCSGVSKTCSTSVAENPHKPNTGSFCQECKTGLHLRQSLEGQRKEWGQLGNWRNEMVYQTDHKKNLKNAKISNLSNEIP